MKKRCAWVTDDPIYVEYHDREWGVPLHDDRRLFEAVVLDGFQAGLSWLTILKKRENFRRAFDEFDADRIGRYDERKIARLLADPGIVRNRLKIEAAVVNARAFLRIREEFGSFGRYIWGFTGHRTLMNGWSDIRQVPTRSEQSDAMSRDLKTRGFKFVGTTICYAFMQAVGMVHDHTIDCFRYGCLEAEPKCR